MKKLSIMFAAMLVALGFTACNSETEPKLEIPKQADGVFVLNTPQLAGEYLQLVKGGTIEFIASQPDYGVALMTEYGMEVSTTEDFANYRTVPAKKINDPVIVVEDKTVAGMVCDLMGVTSQADFDATVTTTVPLYFRATCQVPGVEGSLLRSNVVKVGVVQLYYATLDPTSIWAIGNFEGAWIAPEEGNATALEPYKIMETGYNTGIFEGTITCPEAPMFRFYTTLTGWDDGNSIGLVADDNPTNVAFDGDGVYEATCVMGKGSWNFPEFPGGDIKVFVDMNKMTVKFVVVVAE